MSRIQKTIGIPAWAYSDNTMYGVRKDYIEYLTYFGNVRMLSMFDKIHEDLDLLVLPGGPDVNPARYGQIPSMFCGNPNVFMEAFDTHHLPLYVELGIPIFGICRGMQTLNVHFGGTLIQEIGAHPTSKTETQAAHDLKFTEHYKRCEHIKAWKVGKVTSRHHQGLDEVAECFDVVAHHDDIPEVIVHKTGNIAGVQYHPESNVEEPDNLTTSIVNALLEKNLIGWREAAQNRKLA